MLPRKKFREVVFQLLYSHHFIRIEGDDYIFFMMKILKTTKKNIKEAYEKIMEIEKKILKIDEIIKTSAIDYKFERISKVELNILRLGLYELLFDDNIPAKVAMSEAIRLCRKFSSRQSAKFVNAILDGEYKKTEIDGS